MLSFKAIVGILFGLLIVSIIILGLISYRYNEKVINTSLSVSNAHRVIQVIDEISSVFKDVQLESNAMFIEDDTGRLNKYKSARSGILSLMEELATASKTSAVQQSDVDSLNRLVTNLISFTDSAPHAGTSADRLSERFGESIKFRDKAGEILRKMEYDETALLRQREQENSKSIASFNRAFGQLLTGIVVLILVAFFSIRYNFNKLLRIDEQLRQAQEKTTKALATEIELNKLKSNFVALASHEFRTPLTTILSSASLLENYTSGENQVKASKHISRIKSSVNSLTSILDEFLSLTKIEEGRIVPNLERLDLKQYLETCVAALQNFAKPGQTIVYTHEGPSVVDTDPVLINNILNNVVSNAIKYSPENSPIHVKSHINDMIHITVQDQGMGIPEQDKKHLFERFYRASNAGTIHGTGLGLHIMRHYVDMLNGTVQISSEVGKGTKVEILLQQATH